MEFIKNKTRFGIILILLGLCLVLISELLMTTGKEARKKETHLRDSLEMEYNKQQLKSYPYDHSKIPTDDTIK